MKFYSILTINIKNPLCTLTSKFLSLPNKTRKYIFLFIIYTRVGTNSFFFVRYKSYFGCWLEIGKDSIFLC